MYKKTFKMVNGDIIINQDLTLVSGQEELRQNIENRLSVNQGEWFLDIGLGLDYPSITGKGVMESEIEFALRECCLQDDRVREVSQVVVEVVPETRVVYINLTIIDKGGSELFMEEVVNIG